MSLVGYRKLLFFVFLTLIVTVLSFSGHLVSEDTAAVLTWIAVAMAGGSAGEHLAQNWTR